jgi:hypothetical protein
MLTYHKAVLAAVLEQPPTKPTFVKDFPWRLRLDALRRYRDALARWQKIGEALGGQHVQYLPIHNTPSSMRGMHGAGTLRKPLPDHTIVHTRPNHATRRANGELGQARRDEIERQQEDIAAARLAIESGTWGQHQTETFLEAA